MGIDPKRFKAPFIDKDTLRAKADDFRTRYSPESVPVDILSIVEFDLRIEIRPVAGLKSECDADATLLGDLKTILVDKDAFLEDRFQNRLRFSVAHEIGHWVLHRELFGKIQHESVQEWIQFYEEIPDDEYRFLEFQANEFAGRLLVPRDRLVTELRKAKRIAVQRRLPLTIFESDQGKEYVATSVAKAFGVSADVIIRRLDKEEGVWPPAD